MVDWTGADFLDAAMNFGYLPGCVDLLLTDVEIARSMGIVHRDAGLLDEIMQAIDQS